MPGPRTLLVMAVAATGLSACVSQQERVSNRENLLSAAGFTIRPVDSPARRAEFDRLPPDKLVRRTRGDNVSYLYADPVVCNCLYIGTQQDFSHYQQERFQKRITTREELAATEFDGAWDWGPWGPGWWGPLY